MTWCSQIHSFVSQKLEEEDRMQLQAFLQAVLNMQAPVQAYLPLRMIQLGHW
jgi:hypothetical protein